MKSEPSQDKLQTQSNLSLFRSEVTERLRGTYTLNVRFESESRKETFNLKYQGTKTILEIKTDLYTLTNVQVRYQVWSGWPPNIDDQTILALSGIRYVFRYTLSIVTMNFVDCSYPEHDLILRPSVAMNHEARERRNNTNVVQIDSDDEEFEDASETFNVDDEYFVDSVASKRMEPLSKSPIV